MILNKDFFKWVDEHIKDNPMALRLKYAGKDNEVINYSDAITQIECRKKFGTKLASTLSTFPDFYFPSVLAGEQSTSDLLASYHNELIRGCKDVIDLTAGLGIDVFHFASDGRNVTAVELEPKRTEALLYNINGLGLKNISVCEGDCRNYITEFISKVKIFDAAFIDPARRDSDQKRVYALADCSPDILVMRSELSRMCRKLIIKASPMLDISHCIKVLGKELESVIALGTNAECKELLLILNYTEKCEQPRISAVTLSENNRSEFSFKQEDESNCAPNYGREIKKSDYIYEPYPAVMKSGAFNILADRFGLWQFCPNTKLLYSDNEKTEFPGNTYKVVDVLPYASKVIKRLKNTYPNADIAVRNFRMTADELRSRLGIKDGGNFRIYGISDSKDNKLLVVTEKN